MSYGHAAELAAAPRCAVDGCDRPAFIDSEAADGALVCARCALTALTALTAQENTTP